MTAQLLLIGAGDLGTEIGLRFAARDVSASDVPASDDVSPSNGASAAVRPDAALDAQPSVVAVRRRAELVPAPLVGVSGDVADGLPAQLPTFDGAGGGPRFLVVCLTAGGRDESAYRATFLDAVGAVLADVRDRGWAPDRAVFVSSTGVCAPSGDVDETTAPAPGTPTAQVLLDAERAFLAGLPAQTSGIVVRPSGLYGPGREWFIDQVRQGRVSDPARMTHRAHRDDVARAIVHLLTMPGEPDDLYLVTDDAPTPAGEVAAVLAGELGVPAPSEWTDRAPGAPDRLLSNARLRATGFDFTYPSFREGYRAVLAGTGQRHP